MVKKTTIPGVYETIRTYSGVFVFLPEHQERLKCSCEAVELEYPDLAEVVEPYRREDVRLRVAVNEAGVKVEEEDLPAWHGSFLYNEVWPVKVFDGARENPEIKSTDTEMQKKAREDAIAEGYGEVLLVDAAGLITEGGITNVFFVDGEKLVTPGRGMLPGIARELVLRAAEDLGIEVELRDVRLEELDGFDAVFLTNSIRGMVAAGPIHPLMQRISDWCTDFIKKRIDEAERK